MVYYHIPLNSVFFEFFNGKGNEVNITCDKILNMHTQAKIFLRKLYFLYGDKIPDLYSENDETIVKLYYEYAIIEEYLHDISIIKDMQSNFENDWWNKTYTLTEEEKREIFND